MDENGSSARNLIAGFKSTGICPLNPEEVTKRLPKVKNVVENDGDAGKLWAMEFQEYLSESRRKETAPLRTKKRRLLGIQSRKSVDDSILKTTNTSVNDNDTKKSAKQSNKRKKERKNTTDLLESDDSVTASNNYSIHDSSSCEAESSDGEKSTMEFDASEEHLNLPPEERVEEKDIVESSFAIVNFLTEGKRKQKKQFIGQVTKKSADSKTITFRFMRNFSKCKNVYVFPPVDDIAKVKIDQIVKIVTPLDSRRGRFIFPYELN